MTRSDINKLISAILSVFASVSAFIYIFMKISSFIKMPRYTRIIFLFQIYILLSTHAFSQNEPQDTSHVTKLDSLSVIFIKPIPLVGTIDKNLRTENIVSDSLINFGNYRYAGDLLSQFPSVLNFDFGSLGLQPDITIQGLGMREVSFLVDGIPLNDPLTGLYNPYLYPTEHIERMEIVQGTRSFLYGFNSTGGVINFVTKSKKAVHPYSHLRYSESGYGFGIVDGTVSQDIVRGLNITMGAQHTVYGERFQNENYDCWNARVKTRYNIDDKWNLFASEMYNQTLLGLNGGVDITATPDSLRFESLQAIVKNTNAYEKITRHDVQFGTAARLLPDSEAISTASVYFTSSVRGYRDLRNQQTSSGTSVDQFQQTRWFGLKLIQNLNVANQQMDFGAEIQSERVHQSPATKENTATRLSVYGKFSMSLFEQLTLTPYGRFDNYRDQHLFAYGGDAELQLHPYIKIFGGYSRSFRMPTFQEQSGTDTLLSSLITDNLPERHHLFEVGILLSNHDWFSMELRSFHRTIWNVIAIEPEGNSMTKAPYTIARHQKKIIEGISGSASIRVGSFYLEGQAQFLETFDHQDRQIIFPKFSANGGIYFWDKLLHNNLDLKFGINGKAFTGYIGREYNQQSEEYLPVGQVYNIQPAGVIDLVIIAHVGKAYIHFIMDNLLNRNYVVVRFYPMPERQLRFGVSWEFLD